MDHEKFFLKKILDTSPSLMYICRVKEHRSVFLNEPMLKTLGVTEEQLSKKEKTFFADSIHPDDREKVRLHHLGFENKRDDAYSDVEFRIKEAGDGWRWIRSRESVFSRDKGGEIQEILGIAQDVTEQKIKSEILKRDEEMFESSFNQAPYGGAILSPEAVFIKINKYFCEKLEYEEHELVSKSFKTITHPDDVGENLENIEKLKKGEIEEYVTQKRYIKKGGDFFIAQTHVKPIKDESRNIIFFKVVVEDITSQITNLEILKKSEELSNSGSYLFDVKNSTWTSSENLDKIFGIPSGYEKTAESWLKIVHEDDRDMMRDYLQNYVIGEGHEFLKEYRIVRQNDGEVRLLLGIGQLDFRTGSNLPFRMFGVIRDITKEKESQKKEKELVENEKKLNEFLMGREAKMAEMKKEIKLLQEKIKSLQSK